MCLCEERLRLSAFTSATYTTEGQTEEGGQFLSWETLFQVEEDYVDLLRCGVHSYKSTINFGRDFHNLSERKKNSVNSTKSAYF